MTPLIEDQLRAALRARAGDVRPAGDLAETAQVRAVRLRRTKRIRVAASVAVVAGAAAVIPWLSTLGPLSESAPPVQPNPSVSAEPVPESVINQASETRALLYTYTTIVDGTGADVLTVTVPLEDLGKWFTNRVDYLSRAAGGYVVTSGASLTAKDAPPHSITFVRPDGSTTLLGNPEPGSTPVLSPDGSLVAFDAATSPNESLLVVTDLTGRTLHQYNAPGIQEVHSLSPDGLWYSCGGSACADGGDTAPYYWDFASDTVTQLPIPTRTFWAAQSGDQMVLVGTDLPRTLEAFDVSVPAAPQQLWSVELPALWVAFDGSGTRLLVGDPRGTLVSLDAVTGEVLDRVDGVGGMGITWYPDNRWLGYGLTEDGKDVVAATITPAADGTLSVTRSTYPPYEGPDYAGSLTFAGAGRELPPPTPR